MPLQDRIDIAENNKFRNKVRAALIRAADDIKKESPQPANHADRVALANLVLGDEIPQGTGAYNNPLFGPVLTKMVYGLAVLNQTLPGNADDQTLIDAIKAIWDTYTGVVF